MQHIRELLKETNRFDAYLILRELFMKSMMYKPLPTNWREIISILDKVFDIHDASMTANINTVKSELEDRDYFNDQKVYQDAYLCTRQIIVDILTHNSNRHWKDTIRKSDMIFDVGDVYCIDDLCADFQLKKKGPMKPSEKVNNTSETANAGCSRDCSCNKTTSPKVESQKATTFKKELESLINKYSLENNSNTPDFMLADYLINCFDAYNKIKVWNDKWHSVDGVPKNERDSGPCLDRANGTSRSQRIPNEKDNPFNSTYFGEMDGYIPRESDFEKAYLSEELDHYTTKL